MDSLVAQMVKHLPAVKETQIRSQVRKIPWRRKWQPTPVLLPRKFHEWSSPVGYSPWGRKESDTTEQLHFPSKRTPEVYCLIPSLTLKPTDSSFCRRERQSQFEAKLSTIATMQILFREIQV